MDDLSGRKKLLKASRLKRGRVLDIGLGECGCMSLFLAKKGFDVVGIDNSTKAIHNARKEAEKAKHKGTLEIMLCNAEDLLFGNNEFDAVFSYHSMHHIENVEGVIGEMFRVCKDGGLVLISDLHENGRKAYEHEPDKTRLLEKMEKILEQHTREIKKISTKNNMMFICKK